MHTHVASEWGMLLLEGQGIEILRDAVKTAKTSSIQEMTGSVGK